jgi:hypothetical protein
MLNFVSHKKKVYNYETAHFSRQVGQGNIDIN